MAKTPEQQRGALFARLRMELTSLAIFRNETDRETHYSLLLVKGPISLALCDITVVPQKTCRRVIANREPTTWGEASGEELDAIFDEGSICWTWRIRRPRKR